MCITFLNHQNLFYLMWPSIKQQLAQETKQFGGSSTPHMACFPVLSDLRLSLNSNDFSKAPSVVILRPCGIIF